MALTPTETQTVKNLMGYGNLTVLALPYVDVAVVFETVVQNNLDAYGEGYIRTTILPNVAQLDTDIMSVRNRYGIKELVGDVVFDTTPSGRQHTQLIELREYWIDRLAQTIRIPRAAKINNSSSVDVY